MEKYVAYHRVSTKAQGRSGLGLDAQAVTIRKFVEDRGRIVGAFTDIESGRRDERIELWKAIALAKREEAALVIARLDRFSRRVSFIATLMEKGVRLLVVDMPHATDFQLHIFAALAQEERRLISLRTRAALAQAKERGQRLGRHGTVLARQHQKAADDFADGLSQVLGKGWQSMSFSEAARILNAAGHRTPTGCAFHPQSVKNYWTRVYGGQNTRSIPGEMSSSQ